MLRTSTVLVAVLALATPLVPPAQAEPPAFTPVHGWSRALSGQVLTDQGQRLVHTERFEMVGVTWQGRRTPHVEVRTHTRGEWTRWQLLSSLDEHVPNAGTAEAADASTTATAPLWVGPSDGVQVRVDGGARRLRLVLVDPGTRAADQPSASRVSTADALTVTPQIVTAGLASRSAPMPRVFRRRVWGANPNWRNGGPHYNGTIKGAHIHHTATSNSYSRSDVPGILRSMYWYHTKQLGWSDLGYNFLVDKFGRIWEGRAGGVRHPVRGAHTLGFNHASFGIAVIGSYGSVRPRARVVGDLVRLTAWKLDKYGRRPSGSGSVVSKGSDRYPKGKRVWVRRIDGHRDTNYTACPGDRLYAQLPNIRRQATNRAQYYS